MEPNVPRQVTDQDSQPPMVIAELRLRRDAGPVLVAFGRPVSQQDTAAAELVHQGPLDALGGLRFRDEPRDAKPPESPVLSDWRRLPGEMLEYIFSWLPLDDQARCAQVCRLWHRFVPQDRMQQAAWLAHCGPVLRKVQYALAAACRARSYPFLRTCAPDVLPRVRRQEGSAWLPGSLLHALHHQLTAAPRCELMQVCRPSVMHESGEAQIVFSPCGRDLALLDKRRLSAKQQFFSCRRNGLWHAWFNARCEPSCLLFDTLLDACFFCGFANGNIQCWEYSDEGDKPSWQRFMLGRVATLSPVRQLFLTPGARYLVALSRSDRGEGADSITVFERTCALPHRQTWVWSEGGSYSHPRFHLVDLAISPSRQQKVVCSCERGSAEPSHRLILCRPASEPGARWQRTLFAAHPGTVLRILYSPDGNQLFVAMAEGIAAVWRVADDRLEPQVTMTCHVHDGRRRLSLPVTIYNRGDLYGRWQPFSGDSRQLAVPVSPVAVQMWRCEAGQWSAQERVEVDAGQPVTTEDQKDLGESGYDRARYTLLSDNGRVLVLVSLRRLSIWHWQERSGWQTRLAWEDDPPTPEWPHLDALLLGACNTHCLVATGPVLALYGPDAEDQFRCKAKTETGSPVHRLVSSPDGLSFTTQGRRSRAVILWRLRVCPGPSPP